MIFYKIKKEFRQLPLHSKLIVLGSLTTVFGTLIPWYEDQDPYGGKEIFYGMSGPLYLIGIFIFLMALLTLGTFWAEMRYKKTINLPIRNNQLWLVCGAQSLLLIVTALSIYYHPKFGLDIFIKQTRFGLFISFLGIILYSIGAYQDIKTSIAETRTLEEKAKESIKTAEYGTKTHKISEELRSQRRFNNPNAPISTTRSATTYRGKKHLTQEETKQENLPLEY